MNLFSKIGGWIGFWGALAVAAVLQPVAAGAPATPDRVDVVVIDAGHGGKDAGCVSKNGVREKDVALSVALKFGKLIQTAYPDVKVVYTRSDDRFIELWKRGQIANDHHADLFVSIHCNAAKNTTAKGTETWIRGSQKDDANLAEVQRENAVVMQEQNHEKNYSQSWMDMVSATVMQDAGFENSIYFSGELQKIYARIFNASPDRGVKQGPFYVLWKSARPSVLTEIGFLSNPEEEKILKSEEGQNKVAQCLLEAFGKYKKRIDSRSGLEVREVPATQDFLPSAKTVIQEQSKEEKVEIDSLTVERSESDMPAQLAPAAQAQTPAQAPVETSVPEPSQAPVQTPPAETPAQEKPARISPQAPAQSSVQPAAEPQSVITYKVQISASSNQIEPEPRNFNGLQPLSVYYDSERKLYKYYYGQSDSYDQIQKSVETAKRAGYEKAFIVAFENGRSISVGDARRKQNEKK